MIVFLIKCEGKKTSCFACNFLIFFTFLQHWPYSRGGRAYLPSTLSRLFVDPNTKTPCLICDIYVWLQKYCKTQIQLWSSTGRKGSKRKEIRSIRHSNHFIQVFFILFHNTSYMFLTVLCKFKNISPIFLLSSYCDANFIYIRTIFQKFQMTIISFIIKL